MVKVYDTDGHFMALVTPGYVERARARGELARIKGGYALREDAEARLLPKHELTADQRRRQYLAKQRKGAGR